MYTFAKTFLVVSGLALSMMLPVPVTQADDCGPVKDFIQLGDSANQCNVAIRLNRSQASEIIENDSYCKNVRSSRDKVENKVNKMPQATVNRCANKNQKHYTAAATALQKMYQLELSLGNRQGIAE